MSAFIVSKKHIATLANFAIEHGAWLDDHRAVYADFNHIYKTLAAENVRSVCARYSSDKAADYASFVRPSLCGKTEPVSTIAIVKLCDCLEYQSCETEDWRSTPACKLLGRIRDTAIRLIPGYEQAPWGI